MVFDEGDFAIDINTVNIVKTFGIDVDNLLKNHIGFGWDFEFLFCANTKKKY